MDCRLARAGRSAEGEGRMEHVTPERQGSQGICGLTGPGWGLDFSWDVVGNQGGIFRRGRKSLMWFPVCGGLETRCMECAKQEGALAAASPREAGGLGQRGDSELGSGEGPGVGKKHFFTLVLEVDIF